MQLNDEPDIIVGGEPSAPPIATAVSATPIATAVSASPIASAVLASNNDPNKNIERTTSADGSLMVKCTTTSRQPNGYRNVTIEYFYVPANMAQTVIMSMDATGDPPSSLYMTKMEQQVLPPGTSEVISHAPSSAAATATATVAGGGGHNPVPQTYTTQQIVNSSGGNRNRGAIIGFCVFVGLAIIMSVIVGAIRNPGPVGGDWPTPAPYYYNDDWTWPTPAPEPRTQNPTREGCKDTPDWVDMFGEGCDWYAGSSFGGNNRCALYGWTFDGDMGTASKNCCVCGGGSTWVPPTPWPTSAPITPYPTKANCTDTPNWEDMSGDGCDFYAANPNYCSSIDASQNCCACGGGSTYDGPTLLPTKAPSPRPTKPSACVDMPDWVDSFGNVCNYYAAPNFCAFSGAFEGDMGPADENCCVCGGGTVPSNLRKLTRGAAIPTAVSREKGGVDEIMDSNLSSANPFRSPTAAEAEEE